MTVDKEYPIIVLIPSDFVFRHRSFLMNLFLLVSAVLFVFCVSLQFVSIRVNASRECLGCTICGPSQFFLPAAEIFNLDP